MKKLLLFGVVVVVLNADVIGCDTAFKKVWKETENTGLYIDANMSKEAYNSVIKSKYWAVQAITECGEIKDSSIGEEGREKKRKRLIFAKEVLRSYRNIR